MTSRQQWRQRDRRLPTRRVTGASAGGGGGVRARARAHRLVCGAGGRDGAPSPPRLPPRAAAAGPPPATCRCCGSGAGPCLLRAGGVRGAAAPLPGAAGAAPEGGRRSCRSRRRARPALSCGRLPAVPGRCGGTLRRCWRGRGSYSAAFDFCKSRVWRLGARLKASRPPESGVSMAVAKKGACCGSPCGGEPVPWSKASLYLEGVRRVLGHPPSDTVKPDGGGRGSNCGRGCSVVVGTGCAPAAPGL